MSTTNAGTPTDAPRVAVIVPCFDEEVTVGRVVRDLRAALPDATVYVYDNNSSDRTAERAREAGAVVRSEPMPGKGNVVRRAFADLDADVYLMIDGDATYDAAAAPDLVAALLAGPVDMVVGTRVPEDPEAYRPGHELGNRGFNLLVSTAFGSSVTDMLSGFRAFSRRFAKTFPAASTRFAIETELTVHAITHRLPVTEVPVGFRDRPEGSESKLSTISDGLDILRTIVGLLHHERPLWLYPGLAAVLGAGGLLLGGDRVGPMLVTLGVALLLGGMLLQSAVRSRREQHRASYLGWAAPRTTDVGAETSTAAGVVAVATSAADVLAAPGSGHATVELTPVVAGDLVAEMTAEVARLSASDPALDDEGDHRVIQLRTRGREAVPPAAGER